MRQLATIKEINDIIPIEGKDRIVLAIVDGWSIVIKKEEFKIGDKCVYIEIDSVLPEKPEFEFLRKCNFRIKTMKMSGVISQGICFPLSILPEGNYRIGDDVTKILGITQYDKTLDKDPEIKETKTNNFIKYLKRFKIFRQILLKHSKNEKENFPSFISKTDETRIQNIPFILNDKIQKWVVTEKIDGQSGTFCLKKKKINLFKKNGYDFIVCSRNKRLITPDNSSYWKVSNKYNLKKVLMNLIGDNEWVCLQGECIAPKVQGNKYKVTEPDLYIFNLIYPSGRVDSISAKEICENNGLKFVPIIETNYILPDTVNEILSYAHGKSKIGDTTREGLVFRSLDGIKSFKAVDPRFLLKYDE